MRIAAVGGVEAVVAALHTHRSVVAVQQKGCGALRNLAFQNMQNQFKIASVSGCEAVVAAMHEHITVSTVVQNACASLTNIGTSEALIDLSQLLVYMSGYGRKTGDGREGGTTPIRSNWRWQSIHSFGR